MRELEALEQTARERQVRDQARALFEVERVALAVVGGVLGR